MILVLDIGNSQIYGGVFDDDRLALQFRRTTRAENTSDEFGLFCRQVLRENDVDPAAITAVAICSVVPDLVHSVRNASMKYFGLRPFLLEPGVRTGLKIRYRNPLEVGSDRIAGAIAAAKLFPGRNAIIVDFGTATTIDALIGGARLPRRRDPAGTPAGDGEPRCAHGAPAQGRDPQAAGAPRTLDGREHPGGALPRQHRDPEASLRGSARAVLLGQAHDRSSGRAGSRGCSRRSSSSTRTCRNSC